MNDRDIDRARLRKVWKLAKEGTTPGERAAAYSRAEAMLAGAGFTIDQIEELLRDPEPKRPRTIFDGFDDWMEEREPGYKARAAAERAEKARRQEDFRRATIRKYGSVERAKAPTRREAAIDAAAAPFLRQVMKTFSNGRFPIWTLAGWSPFDIPRAEMPAAVRDALMAAWPWPKSLAEAAEEIAWWRLRDREIEAAWGGDTGDTCLSIACYARERMVDDALEHEMPAVDVGDLVHRQRWAIERGGHHEEADAAILRDLERLAREGVQSGQPSMRQNRASDRRAAVLDMLADPELARLPDRELARRVGVSPSTVGNLRRKAAQAELAL